MTESDREFLALFEACRWPGERWHHREHIKLAYLYLRQFPLAEALVRLRAGIQAHNAAQGTPESLSRGYHETMTQAWLRLVHVGLCEYGPAESGDAFCERHPELMQAKTLRLFYTRERLMSAEAKATFVEPDLTALPRSGRRTGE